MPLLLEGSHAPETLQSGGHAPESSRNSIKAF